MADKSDELRIRKSDKLKTKLKTKGVLPSTHMNLLRLLSRALTTKKGKLKL